MTDEIATPDHWMRLDDCTAAHLEYVIAHRKYIHAITDRPFTEDCLNAIDKMQMLIEPMAEQGVKTVGELDNNMAFARTWDDRRAVVTDTGI
jgi:hypothetical protein